MIERHEALCPADVSLGDCRCIFKESNARIAAMAGAEDILRELVAADDAFDALFGTPDYEGVSAANERCNVAWSAARKWIKESPNV